MNQPSSLPRRLTHWFKPNESAPEAEVRWGLVNLVQIVALAAMSPLGLRAAQTPIEEFMLKAETLFTGPLATSIVIVAICIAAIMNMSSRRSGGEGYGGVLLSCIVLLGVQRWVAWGQ